MSDKSDEPPNKEDLVITPGGPRPKDSIHLVGPGEVVSFDERGNARVIPLEQQEGNANMAEDLVLTPGGYRPRSVVHVIEPGHVVDGAAGRLRELDSSGQVLADFGLIPSFPSNTPLLPGKEAVLAEEEPTAPVSNWIAYAFWNNNPANPISSFTTTWIVPRAHATHSDQLVYLFNGIQSPGWIYQPVLQWGPSPDGGGNYWAVASWYVGPPGSTTMKSHLTRVNPGDVLVGVMTLTGQSGSSFNYTCQFQGITNSLLRIQNVPQLIQPVITLEAYGIKKCSDYPASDNAVFWGINIQGGSVTPTLNWALVNRVTNCGQHAVVVSNSNPGGEVDIYDRQSGSLSLRQFLTAQRADPGRGVRQFIEAHHPGISSLRALLEL